MATGKEDSKMMNYLFGTFLVLNIVLTSANLYTMYRRNGNKKKCKCQEKEQV